MDPFWLGADGYTSDAGDGGQSRKITRNGGKRRPYGPQQVTDTQKNPSEYNAHRLCAAPMMDWTDFIGEIDGLVHRRAPRTNAAARWIEGDSSSGGRHPAIAHTRALWLTLALGI